MSTAPTVAVESPAAPLGHAAAVTVLPPASLYEELSELGKRSLTSLVLLTTLAGYAWASHGGFEWLRLFHTLCGTALVAVCASILNQAWEHQSDARMRRTAQRPLVTGRFPLRPTVIVGLLLGAAGLSQLAFLVNLWSAALAGLTLGIYILVYTPLKRLTPLNTLVGTIPGAIPPLIGAVAAQGRPTLEGWLLFALLAVWQLPHFYAIAWLYRDDFRNAGLRMISINDPTGTKTGTHAVVSALVLWPVALLPGIYHLAGWLYCGVALVASTGFLWLALKFARQPDRATARRLFLGSILYLPLVLLALAFDAPLHRLLGW